MYCLGQKVEMGEGKHKPFFCFGHIAEGGINICFNEDACGQ